MPRHIAATFKPSTAWPSAIVCMLLVSCSPSTGISTSPSSAPSTKAPPAAAPNPAARNEHPAPMVPKQASPIPPELPAEQVESIIFSLIDGVRTKADLTEPHIEGLTGLSLHRLDNRDASYAKGTTVEGWRFAIGIERFAVDDVRLEIAAIPRKQSEGNSASDCTLPFDKLRSKLDAANFRSDKSTGLHGKTSNWRFSKNRQVVHVDLYPTEPLARGGIECIDHISVVID